MPEQWKSILLGEVCEIKYGKDHKPLAEGDIPVYGSGGIIRFVDKALYSEPSVLIPRLGSLDNLFYSAQPFWTVNTLFWTKIDTSIVVPRFLYYYLHTKKLSMLNHGSAVPRLTVTTLHEIKLQLPSLKEQERIAELLGALDNKIESNRKAVFNLDALILAHYEKLAPKVSGVPLALEELFDVNIGRTPPRKEPEWFVEPSATAVAWASIKDMGEVCTLIKSTQQALSPEAVKRFRINVAQTGDVLVSFKLTVGRVALVGREMCTNEAIACIHSSNPLFRGWLYCFMKSFNYASLGNTSSIGNAVNSKIIKAIEMPLPEQDVLQEFYDFSNPLFELIDHHQNQIEIMTDLRDTLLPELMSGRMQVDEAQGLVMNALETEDTHV